MADQGGASQPQNPQNESPAIQFDRADFSSPAASATATTGEADKAVVCRMCGKPIEGVYYTANQAVICDTCQSALKVSITSGTRTGRFTGAFFAGLAAAALGTLIWFGIRKVTGYEIGLVAIVVGFLVGNAVRKGSNGRGGLGYQLMAALLTYASIAANYVPDVYDALSHNLHDRPVARATTHPSTASATAATDQPDINAGAATDAQLADSDVAAPAPGKSQGGLATRLKSMGIVGKVLLYLIFAVILFVIACAAPIFAGMRNIIGLLIICFAVWEAWKLNRAQQMVFTGPHVIGGTPGVGSTQIANPS